MGRFYQNESIFFAPRGPTPGVQQGSCAPEVGVMGNHSHSVEHRITIMKRWRSTEFSMVESDCYRSIHRELAGRKPLPAAQCRLMPAASSTAQTRLFGHAGQLEDCS